MPPHIPKEETNMTIKLLQTLINFEEDALAYYYNSGASLEYNAGADADEIYANYLFQIYPNEIQNIYNVLSHLSKEEELTAQEIKEEMYEFNYHQ